MQYDIPVLRIHLNGRQRLAADDLPGDGILHLFADDTPQIAGAELAALRLFTQQGKRGFCPAQTDAFCRFRLSGESGAKVTISSTRLINSGRRNSPSALMDLSLLI